MAVDAFKKKHPLTIFSGDFLNPSISELLWVARSLLRRNCFS